MSWLLLLMVSAFVAVEAWSCYDDERRSDGNGGHATIDFGGQWLMGRTIVDGQGRHLYERQSLRQIAQKWYPEGVAHRPTQKSNAPATGDADNLLEWMLGLDDPQVAACPGFVCVASGRGKSPG